MTNQPGRDASSSYPAEDLGRDIKKKFCTFIKVKKEYKKKPVVTLLASNGGWKMEVRYNTKIKRGSL